MRLAILWINLAYIIPLDGNPLQDLVGVLQRLVCGSCPVMLTAPRGCIYNCQAMVISIDLINVNNFVGNSTHFYNHQFPLQEEKVLQAPFLVLQLVTNRELYAGPGRTTIGISVVYQNPNIPIVGTMWSSQVLTRVLYLWQTEAPKKGAWKSIFFLLRVWAV